MKAWPNSTPPLQDARRGWFKVNLFGAGGTNHRMNIADERTGAIVGGWRRLCFPALWAARITQFNVFALLFVSIELTQCTNIVRIQT